MSTRSTKKQAALENRDRPSGRIVQPIRANSAIQEGDQTDSALLVVTPKLGQLIHVNVAKSSLPQVF